MSTLFWPHTQNRDMASFRLRCLRVIDELDDLRADVGLYRNGDKPENLVLSKRYDSSSVQKAIELKEKYGTKLYLDLCDNHFYYENPKPKAVQRAADLRKAIAAVDVVVVSTQYLAQVIRDEMGSSIPVVVIGDLVEAPSIATTSDRVRNLLPYLKYLELRKRLSNIGVEKEQRLVWFGDHGNNYVSGGMNDIQSIYVYLESMSKTQSISLTVVSNSRKKYRSLTRAWPFPTFYLSWHRTFFSEVLLLHGIALIPIQKNPFTEAKTDNRVMTSLMHGLDVFVDEIDSYLDLADRIYINRWEELGRRICVERSQTSFQQYSRDINAGVLAKWRKVLGG